MQIQCTNYMLSGIATDQVGPGLKQPDPPDTDQIPFFFNPVERIQDTTFNVKRQSVKVFICFQIFSWVMSPESMEHLAILLKEQFASMLGNDV